MQKKIALIVLMGLLTGCEQQIVSLCPDRLHMPQTLKVKLKTLEYTDEEADYWKDLNEQQKRLER